MRLYGLGPSAIQWFASYLADRTQYVQVECRLSDPRRTGNQGVPQGSILSPLLFLLFYNDFPETKYPEVSQTVFRTPPDTLELPTSSLSVLYADDDTDHAQDRDPTTLISKIQFEADCSTSWVADNKLVCSGDKTKLLVIATTAMRISRLNGQKLQINVCGKPVEESKSERILGIIANNKLTWWNHLYGDQSNPKKPVPGLIKQLSKRVGMLCQLVKILPKDKFIMTVNGIFMSKLSYCLQLFGNVWCNDSFEGLNERNHSFTKSNLHSLQVLQNKVLRLITGHGYDSHIIDLLSESGMLSVNQLIAYRTIVSIYKIKNSDEPTYLANKLAATRNQVMQLRHRQRNTGVNFNKARGKEGFLYRGRILFNALPISTQSADRISNFKKLTKQWIVQNIPAIPP